MKLPLPLLTAIIVALLVPWSLLTAQQTSPPVSLAQAEGVVPSVPPAPVRPTEVLGWQFTLGILANAVMRKLKESPHITWIKNGAGTVNVVLSALLAAGTSLGIHTEFDAVSGTFMATGLTLTGIVHFGGEWLRAYALQQWTYQAAKS